MDMDWDALRPGQHRAVNMVAERLRRGERNTAIILPTRYGKSDVARVAALLLYETGEVGCTLALSPNVVLMEQLASSQKWREAIGRYRIKLKKDPRIATLTRNRVRPNSNGEVFLSTTMQLVEKNLDSFAAWIESQVHKTGLPTLVFVDECHTGSEDNKWGDAARQLADAGAHVALLTATAERSDGRRIPGFEFGTIEESEVKVYRTSAGSREELVRVDVLEGIRTKLRLKAHVEVTFREAFAENALCKMNWVPFDVDLRGAVGEEHQWLSELSPSRARSEVGRQCRRSVVIERSVRQMLVELSVRRILQPDVAAIVYCGNDTDRDDTQVNKHATQIREEILRQASELDVLIVTSAAEKAKDGLDRFVGGRGDVMIVKQMAALGLDIPRVKVGVDLSGTRTFAALVQRMNRPATPYNGILTCTWITPDDVVSRATFQRMVRDQGGEATAADLAVVDTYEKEREQPSSQESLFAVDTSLADFEDSASNRTDAMLWPTVERIVGAFPALTHQYSYSEIAQRAEAFNASKSDETPTVHDTGVAAGALRSDINNLAGEAIRTWASKNNLGYRDYDYGAVSRSFFSRAYRAANWPKGTHLDESSDLDDLERVRAAMERIVAEVEHQ